MPILPQKNSTRHSDMSKLAVTYAVFAAIATAINIAAQDLSLRADTGPFSVLASVAIGTVVGLVAKYALDKKYIFSFKPKSAAHDIRTFIAYAGMGVATTAIFWSFEFGFNHIFHTKEARFAGAVIGLAIGYVSKYMLDRKYVFAAVDAN